MIKYDWEKINNYCRYDVQKVLQCFKRISGLLGPCLSTEFNGDSFLLNPRPLFTTAGLVQQDVYDYIEVASLRNYFDYKMRGDKNAYVWQIPKYILLNHNPLINIEKEMVILKYEQK